MLSNVKKHLITKRSEAEVDKFLCSIVFLRFIGPAIVNPTQYSIKLPDGATKSIQKQSVEVVKLILKVVNGLVQTSRNTNRDKYFKQQLLAIENISALVDPTMINQVQQGMLQSHTRSDAKRIPV
jgi:hypothetical protein